MRTQSAANTGASRMMNSGCTDWNQLDGKLQPKSEVRVTRSANRLRLDPACSNPAQNRLANTNRAMIASTRLRSMPGAAWLASHTKNPAAATRTSTSL